MSDCVEAHRRRIVLGLALGLVAAAGPATGRAQHAAVLYRDEDWYQSRPERQARWIGVLRHRPVVAGPAGRMALSFELTTADSVLPVYAPGAAEKIAPFVGQRVEVEAKLVDLSAEGFGKELWPATIMFAR